MKLDTIDPVDFMVRPVHLWDVQWLLLTAGDFSTGHFNCMTIGWGSMGFIWRRPFVQVMVRPVRHTYQFMQQYDTFTVCAFPQEYHTALNLLGTKSGRDGDKIAEAGLTPMASTQVPAPCFQEAELIIECRTIYWDDIDPAHFSDPALDDHYPRKDYHRIFLGEILLVHGIDRYKNPTALKG